MCHYLCSSLSSLWSWMIDTYKKNNWFLNVVVNIVFKSNELSPFPYFILSLIIDICGWNRQKRIYGTVRWKERIINHVEIKIIYLKFMHEPQHEFTYTCLTEGKQHNPCIRNPSQSMWQWNEHKVSYNFGCSYSLLCGKSLFGMIRNILCSSVFI